MPRDSNSNHIYVIEWIDFMEDFRIDTKFRFFKKEKSLKVKTHHDNGYYYQYCTCDYCQGD